MLTKQLMNYQRIIVRQYSAVFDRDVDVAVFLFTDRTLPLK